MTDERWKPVCRAEDVPLLEGRRVEVYGFYIAVFNTEKGFYAVGDVCPHLGGPLSDGEVAGETVACPLHARKIDLPTGRVTNDNLPSVAAFPVKVEGGLVSLEVSALFSRLSGEKRCAGAAGTENGQRGESQEEVA